MIRTLLAVAVAGAFALPVAASAANDNMVVAQGGGGGGGGDTGASNRQEGANPPGQASPGAPRSATSSTDRETGAAHRTNPSGSGATAHRARFDALDKNHDGYISRDEAKNAPELNTRFTELDTNNDGKLSRDEYNALRSSARGGAGATARPMSSKKGVPDKGPGAQEPANRALGTAGSGKPEGGGTSNSK